MPHTFYLDRTGSEWDRERVGKGDRGGSGNDLGSGIEPGSRHNGAVPYPLSRGGQVTRRLT